MDYAFEFEQVVSIISAPFTVNEQFCLGELLLCSIRQKKKENSNLLTLGICRDDNVTSVWRGELASCVAFITSENTCCCLSSSLFLVPQISSSPSRSPKRRPPSAPHSPLLLPLHSAASFIDSIVFSLCSIFCLSHLRSLHTLHLVSLPILLPLPLSCAPLPPSLSLSPSLLFLLVCLSLRSAVSLLYA